MTLSDISSDGQKHFQRYVVFVDTGGHKYMGITPVTAAALISGGDKSLLIELENLRWPNLVGVQKNMSTWGLKYIFQAEGLGRQTRTYCTFDSVGGSPLVRHYTRP